MATATLNIVDVRRVASALSVTEARIVKAAEELELVPHFINSRAFIDVDDEDRIRQYLQSEAAK